MKHRIGLLVAGCIGVCLGMASGASAAEWTACKVDGSRVRADPMTLNLTTTTYTFEGPVSSCTSQATVPAAGTLYVGRPVTIDGVEYRAPAAAASPSMSCDFDGGSGNAIVLWGGGKLTIFHYDETGIGLLAEQLTGTVTDSISLVPKIPGTDGKPLPAKTFHTTQYAVGQDVRGVLAVTNPDPVACNGSGTTSSTLSGTLAFDKLS